MTMPLQIVHTGYAENSKSVVVSPPSGKQIQVYEVSAKNSTGGAIAVGILKRLSLSKIDFYKVIAADSPDATKQNDIKTGTATRLFTTTNNDGFLVQSSEKFSLIGLNISSGSAGGTFTVEFFNGSAFTTLTTITAPTAYGAGTQLIFFLPPINWAPGTNSTIGGDSDKYSILVRATTAPAGPVDADLVWTGRTLDYSSAIAAGGDLSLRFPDDKPLVLSAEEGIQPYFGGTANANNSVKVVYQTQD